MYKTVRHGENSLQYKILAQQEEGLGTVKCRKSTRGKTAGIITIVLLLVCGVIATAVLVPLVLTNDFITLTGTFQKFSVSTLRRSHSGNHVVVMAKKPHGWNSSRQSVFSSQAKAANASVYHVNNKTKQTTIPTELPTTNDSLNAYTATSKTATLEDKLRVTTPCKKITDSVETTTKSKISEPSTSTESHYAGINARIEDKSTSTLIPLRREQDVGETLAPNSVPRISSTSTSTSTSPSWYPYRKWSYEEPDSSISWSKDRTPDSSFSTAVGGFCAVAVIIIMIIVLVKSLPDKKKTVQKESAESKEDKKRLLKPSARTSDEE